MNSIQTFQNNQFGQIRVAMNELGEPLFAATDVCQMLGYANPSKAVSDHTEPDERYNESLERGGTMLFVSESGLYSLILRSNKQEAKVVRKWVTSEVLPSIRKHGIYATPDTVEKMIADPDSMIAVLTALKNERTKRIEAEVHNRELAPKALFADAVAASDRSVLVAELAKVLQQNGINIGQNRLFEWLRQNGYLCSKGEYYNQPTQRSMEMGLFELKKTSITKPDGSVLVTCTTKVTGKGQIYFVNRFLTKIPA